MEDRLGPLRESIVSVLGAPPDPAPLNPETLEVVQADGYRREKVRYQVERGDWAYAYLLIPDDLAGPTPAIFCHHQHHREWRLGKSEVVGLAGDPDQATALELARMGFVTFAPDALAFEERRPRPDAALDNNFFEYTKRLIRGETLLRKILWDVSRGLDYLVSRPEVNPKYIGFIGHSYGAKVAVWAAAFDARLRATVAHCGVGTFRAYISSGVGIQIEFAVPRILQVADTDSVLTLVAPRPFLISTTSHDRHSPDARLVYERARVVYEGTGYESRLGFYFYEGNHVFTAPMRHNAYRWLDGWLRGLSDSFS